MKCLKLFMAFMLCISLVFICTPQVFADETSDAILNLLIRKGIITQEEIDEMKARIASEKPKVFEKVVEEATKK